MLALDRPQALPGEVFEMPDAEGLVQDVGREGQFTAPAFLLVPQVKLSKRLDLARDADRALDRVPGLIVANWMTRS